MIAPTRVLACGDWHGEVDAVVAAMRAAQNHGCEVVVQLGDLGILWPGEKPTLFDRPLMQAVSDAGVTFVFIDGNHDNHAALNAYDRDRHGWAEVLTGIWWAPRGHRWTWSGVTFGALGGAFSVDRTYRIEGVDVWCDLEEPTRADVQRLGPAGLDVLLTHDVPAGVPVVGDYPLDNTTTMLAQVSRDLLGEAVAAAKPRRVFSGHWHQRLSHLHNHSDGTTTVVDVLDRDRRSGNAVVLALPGLTVADAVLSSRRRPGWT
ncbi:Ser/Thr phosphatase family protein [Aeromicrobium marinum DSM 15272]|uniref:Ser/Thr phosphatase family protein n=1 Tax=Aeromicrobium marinum DSM 15272 TaxID=585531 RepID=E2S854_9ACTN|nr:metallophosphoesterase [Aeromicrobium marinum]EFQ84359.1 Ser/Thr phosphatase family protein [Aeromicrobium marinum DSM 15272]